MDFDNLDYILDDLQLWEAQDLRYKISREIWRRWKAGEKRDHLIDRHDELETLIYNLKQLEGED